jgi:V/A-type H+/Na+-transporting ATPase subunit A
MIREDFLRQSAYDEIDTYASLNKQQLMLGTILHFRSKASGVLQMEVNADTVVKAKVRARIARMKEIKEQDMEKETKSIRDEIDREFNEMVKVGEKASQ